MIKRSSQRQSGHILAAAAASVGLIGWAATQADASILIDVRATAVGGAGGSIGGQGKLVSGYSVGSTVTLDVFARITGANSIQTTGNYDGFGGINDTRNDDSLQIISGSFNSVGALRGNYDPTNGGGGGAQVGNFAAGGSTNGVANDWDGDGDLDIGAADANLTNMWSARSANPNFATKVTNAFGPSAAAGLSPPFQPDLASQIINASTSELHLGTLTFVVTNPAGDAFLNFVPRPVPTNPGSALWFEDGVSTGKVPSDGLTVGAPVHFFIPEPSTVSLLGIGSLGLLARRNKKNT